MRKCYINLKVEYIEGYAYNTRPLKRRKYYEYNYNKILVAKSNKDAFGIIYYKLLNNSSYGKLLERPHNDIFQNYIREDGTIDSLVIKKEEQQINARFTYLPVGSAIPARSRVCLCETALLFGSENIIYFDTDSIFFLWNDKTKTVWESNLINKEDRLGGWGREHLISKAQFTAPKRYKLQVVGQEKPDVKAGGINFNEFIKEHHKEEFKNIYNPNLMTEKEAIEKIKTSYEEFNIVSSIWKVQRSYRVEGGTIIEFENKEMKIQKKYESIYKKNINDTI